MRYIDVLLPLALDKPLTYAVSDEMASEITLGARVVVPLGKKKEYTAIAIELHDRKPEYEVKEVMQVMDREPIVSPMQLNFWQWIASYYMCTTGEVMKAAIPAGLKLESETMVTAAADFVATAPLSKNEQLVMDNISAGRQTSISDLSNQLGIKNILPVVMRLYAMGALTTDEEIIEGFKAKKEAYVALTDDMKDEAKINKAFEDLAKAPKQLDLLMAYVAMSRAFIPGEAREVSRKELLEKAQCSSTILTALVEKRILTIYDKEVSRIDVGRHIAVQPRFDLSAAQQQAMQSIQSAWQERDVVLLHGVTSSGKTEIYIHLIEQAIASGRQALFLLPEIALTTQITQRLKRVFGSQLGVYHSKFSDNERVEVWNAMLRPDREFKVILGVRSSILLPFRDLGLIIVDEEHETTYKQQSPAPRYNARDAAIVLAMKMKAKVLLGSATPSIESYHNATVLKKYGLVELSTRFAGIKLPSIKVVDVKDAKSKKQMVGSFSQELIDEMKRTLDKGEQVILFQNRRGFSPYIECNSCAFVPRCINCDVSLTYHKFTNMLSCHYCGYTIGVPTLCPSCQMPTLSSRGLGTEKAEEEIRDIFPNAKVARLDLDVAKTRNAYEKVIHDFESGKTDILVGTQMISKGLDFERVRLVGVLRADGMLHYPDFRSAERAFQLMTQVSGRAGRKGGQGRVIIQTMQPDHPTIEQVQRADYRAMYHSQVSERTEFFYPPVCRIIYLTIRAKDEARTDVAAETLAATLRSRFDRRVYGPDVPVLKRILGMYLKNIVIKIEKEADVAAAKRIIKECCNSVIATHKGVAISIDVDPM